MVLNKYPCLLLLPIMFIVKVKGDEGYGRLYIAPMFQQDSTCGVRIQFLCQLYCKKFKTKNTF